MPVYISYAKVTCTPRPAIHIAAATTPDAGVPPLIVVVIVRDNGAAFLSVKLVSIRAKSRAVKLYLSD
jgi:hypothetical protein